LEAVPPVSRVFLLSPARCNGVRAQLVFNPEATFPLARGLREGGAPLGEVFTFMSGLYFRGKLTSARAFARPPAGVPGILVITPTEGLVSPDLVVDLARLTEYSSIDIDLAEPRYREPLVRDARRLAEAAASGCEFVLLGSVASGKYVEPFQEVFGERLLFPADFVGRGDMSRGGLLLRAAEARSELACIPVRGARLHGERPPRLVPRPRAAQGPK
jgi:hypothetical protein